MKTFKQYLTEAKYIPHDPWQQGKKGLWGVDFDKTGETIAHNIEYYATRGKDLTSEKNKKLKDFYNPRRWVEHPFFNIQCAVAVHGDSRIKHYMLKKHAPFIGEDGSRQEYNKQRIRQMIAQYGDDSHRDKLVNDPHWKIRQIVAEKGNFKHKKALWNDPDKEVRKAARE